MITTNYTKEASHAVFNNIQHLEDKGYPLTAKQEKWLESASDTYAVPANFREMTKIQASKLITDIIDGRVAKLQIEHMFYIIVVGMDKSVGIKSVKATSLESAKEYGLSKYQDQYVATYTDVDTAKTYAKHLHEELNPVIALSDLELLTSEELVRMATELGIKLGRTSKRESILKKIKEAVA